MSNQERVIQRYGQQAGTTMLIMSESSFFKKISAYIAENKRNTALEAELSNITLKSVSENEAISDSKLHASSQSFEDPVQMANTTEEEVAQKLDAIYDEEPLGFEKNPMASNIKMLAQDPLEEVDLGDGSLKSVTYIGAKLDLDLKTKVITLLKENKDCFARDY